MKKKLVVFHPAIAPYRVDFFNALAERFDAVFYFEFRDALEQSFDQEKLKSRLKFTPRYLKPGFMGIKNLRLQVWSILKQEQPDLIFCSEFNQMGFLVTCYRDCYLPDARVYTICDDCLTTIQSESLLKRWMRKSLVHLFDGVILTNEETAKWYKAQYGGRWEKYPVFPIIQDEHIFRVNVKRSLPIARRYFEELNLYGQVVVLFVGRLIEIKNLDYLLKGIAEISRERPEFVLMLVGEGERRGALEVLARELGIEDRVIFMGKKQGDELLACYALGQIFVLPSVYERFGAVICEAMMAGCEPVCSELAGAAELVEKAGCGVIDPYDVSTLVKEFHYLLKEEWWEPPLEPVRPLTKVVMRHDNMPYRFRQQVDRFLDQIDTD